MIRRTLHYPDFDAVLQDAELLLTSGYDRVGTWSLGQNATHLAKVMEMSLDGFPTKMPWFITVFIRWFALGKILRRQVFTRPLPAPKFLQPGDVADDREGLDRLRAVITRLKAQTEPMKPSPIFGKLTNEEWRSVHLWHCEHHFSFLLPRTTVKA